MRLDALVTSLRRFAAGFDPALVSVRDAKRIRDEASTIESIAAAVKAQAAARVAESSEWKKSGERSPAHELAKKSGTSVAQARAAIETGRRLQELPVTADAVRSGQLSMEQATLIADAASADPNAEAQLLEVSRSNSVGELRDTCGRVKANACDQEERRRRIHERRGLRDWVDAEGVGHLHLRDNPERVAEIAADLAPTRDQLFKQARREDRREPLQAYAADALYQVVCRPKSRAKPTGATKLLARVDLERLLGLPGNDDAVCEIAGYGPVAVSAIQELVKTRDPFLAAIVTKGQAVVGVAHLGRRPNVYQRSALEWL